MLTGHQLLQQEIPHVKNTEEFSTLSKRGQGVHPFPQFFEGRFHVASNPYNKVTNPNGGINLGVAENILVSDLLCEKISQIRKEEPIRPNDLNYLDFTGSPELKKQLASFFCKRVFNRSRLTNEESTATSSTTTGSSKEVDSKVPTGFENKFFIGNGSGSIIEMLCLGLADEHDYAMIPTPMYYAFERDLYKRFKCHVLPVHCFDYKSSGVGEYTFDEEALNQALEQAKKQGKNVRMFFHVNPHNPTGIIFSKDTTRRIIKWCLQNKIHCIADEVYALTLFTKHLQQAAVKEQEKKKATTVPKEFVPAWSVCQEFQEELQGFQKYVHTVYSFSKDFCMNGFRVGVLFSENSELLEVLRACAYFTSTSSDTQHLIAKVLEDEEFLDRYFATNLERLWIRCSQVVSFFKEHNIRFIMPESGIFIWFNVFPTKPGQNPQLEGREYTAEHEDKIWKKILLQGNVNLISGIKLSCSKEPGWMRMCFSAMDMETLFVALERIITCIKE